MRTALFGAVVVMASIAIAAIVAAQAPVDPRTEAQLKQVIPGAAAFSAKSGTPPHFKALAADQTVTGFAFLTTEVDPLERGYDGPIKILVGMDISGVLTGVLVMDHHEPYGDFSVDPPQFAAQFRRKNIRDPFRVGADVDAVSRATVTVSSAARAIRNSARRVATQLIKK